MIFFQRVKYIEHPLSLGQQFQIVGTAVDRFTFPEPGGQRASAIIRVLDQAGEFEQEFDFDFGIELSGILNGIDDSAEQVGGQDASVQIALEDGDIERKSPADFR